MIGAVRAALVLGLLAAGAGTILDVAHRLQGVRGSTGPRAGSASGSVAAGIGRRGEPATRQTGVAAQRAGDIDNAPAYRIPDGLPRIVWSGKDARIETEPVVFDVGEPDMSAESLKTLDSLAAFLQQRPDLRVRIVGHTDSSGPDWANDAVSAERAAAVRDYLIGCGLDRRRLASEGRGGRQPLRENDSAAGRRANRRIEFLLMPPK